MSIKIYIFLARFMAATYRHKRFANRGAEPCMVTLAPPACVIFLRVFLCFFICNSYTYSAIIFFF